MKKTFTILIAAIAAILMMAQPVKAQGQTRTAGDILAKLYNTGGNGYATRQTKTDSYNVGWVLSGSSSGTWGSNGKQFSNVKPTAADLPVVKGVTSNATTSTTGHFFYYTTTAVSNVGSVEFYFANNYDQSVSCNVYLVMGDVKAASGGDAYTQVTLSNTSATSQGASISSSGTYTFTFAETQTSAKFYGLVIKANSAKRFASASLTLKEGSTGGGQQQTVATPQISHTTDTYYGTQFVTLSCNTSGADIYYNMGANPEDPTASSTHYTGAFQVTETTTIKAIAVKDGMQNSDIATSTLTIQPAGFDQDWESNMDGWKFVSVSGGQTWAVSTYNNNKFAKMSGSANSTNNANEDWIISPAFNLSNYSNPVLTFTSARNNQNGNVLEVYFSNDYAGGTNANPTWTQLTCTLPSQPSSGYTDFTSSGDISLSSYSGANCYIGFKYTSTNSAAVTWEVDDIELFSAQPTITVTPNSLSGFTYVEGHGPSTTQTVSVSGSNLTANISLSLGDNSNFEMCQTQNGTYTNSLTLTSTSGTVSATNIYVRLKEGLGKAANYSGTITLTSTDATNKTVSLSGSVTGQTYAIEQSSAPATAHGTITFSPESPIEAGIEVTLTAEPAEGYDFTADSWVFYKESGNDIVVDNSITVTNGKITMPAYDLWVDATFDPKPTFDVTCAYDNTQGSLQATPTSAYEGQTVTLTYSESTNYELDAITLTHTEGGAVAQGVTLTKGEGNTYTFNMPGYEVTATATFVYTIFEGAFEQYTDDIVEGDYIIYASSGAMKNSITSNRFDNGEVSILNNAITNPKNTVVWHIAKIGNTNYWSIYNARVNKYAGGTSSKNQGALYDDTDDDLARWTITYDNGFVFYNYGRSQASSDNTNAYLRQNGSSGWGTYTSGYGNAPTLYKLVEATAPEWSALPTPSIETYENYELDLNELVSGTPAPEITVITSATGYHLEDGVFTFYTETAGEYTFTFTAENSVNTAEAILTVTVTASQYAKAFLTSDNMSNMTGTLGYGNEKTFTSADGRYTWKTTGYQGQTNRLACIQLKKDTSPYILLPNINGRITTIEFDVTDPNSSSLAQGNSTTTQLKFRSSATGSDIATGGDGSTSVKKITIDLTTGNFYSTGYIVSGGGIRVWNITVTYLPYDNFTDLDPEAPMPTLVAGNNYAVPSDMTTDYLTIPATAGIVVKSGATLTVTSTLTNNGSAANLIIEDGGQLKFFDNNAKDGLQATVQKNITGYGNDNSVKTGWNFIASPITESIAPSAVTNLLGEQIADDPVTYNYDLYRLNNTDWENYHQHNENADPFMLANGQGYLYAKSSNTTLSFVGTIKPYDDTYEISVSKGWNLIGNPYTFDAYANVAYYAMNESGTGITATTVATSTAVKPCTGIIVKADEIGSVKFLNAAPSGSANNGNLQMVLAHNVATRDGASVNKTIDNAIVSFNEGTKLQKFYFGEPAANIYIPQNGEDYAIAFSNRQGDMPLNFKTTEAGMYTISFEGDNMDLKGVCLIDMLAEEEIDLSVDPSYTFIGSPADKAERFKIVFSPSTDSGADIFAYQSGSNIIVSGEGELQIFDVMGRRVKTQYVSGVQTVNVNAQGVYIMKLNEKTQKIIVR